jgi:Concanavalin A-like lectin/glucanases superfamily
VTYPSRDLYLPLALLFMAALFASPAAHAESLDLTRKAAIECGDIFNVAEGTIELWVKPATINNNEWILSKTGDKKNGMVLGFGPRIFMYSVRTDGKTRYAYTPKGALRPGKWSHIAITFSKDKATIFVNGHPTRRASEATGNFGLQHLAGSMLRLGRGGSSREFYNGHMYEVRLSDSIRYTRTFKPKRTPLTVDGHTIALWRGDSDGKIVPDAGKGKRDGKIIGPLKSSADTPLKPAPPTKQIAPGAKPQSRPKVKLDLPEAQGPTKIVLGKEKVRAGFRGDGALIINGEAVFPIAARSEKLYEIPEIADCGFNMILGSGEWGAEHYKLAHEKNLLIFAGHHSWMSFRGVPKSFKVRGREETLLKTVIINARDQSKRTIHETLEQFDHQPGVMGWCISDEPEAKLSELAEAGYEIFKSNSPGHIVAQISCDSQWFKNFRHAADVLMVDHYPFQGTPRKRIHRRGIFETYRRVKKAVDDMGGKPVWLMPGLYDPSYWSWKPEETLTLRDMRLANYAGLIAGAKGVVMYHWGNLRNEYSEGEDGKRKTTKISDKLYVAKLKKIATTVAELHKLGPIILNGRPCKDLWIRWVAPGRNGPGPQLHRVWDYEGKRYLMVVNFLDVAIKGQAYGINMSVNRLAYDTTVFLGGSDVSVKAERKPGENTFTVGPRGAGVFLLTRRPIPDVKR